MNRFRQTYLQIYKNKNSDYFSVINNTTAKNFFHKPNRRPNSLAVIGGALGDEGKGRIIDELTSDLLKDHSNLVLYRDNGGSNAGHTVEFGDTKIVLHQLGAGAMQKNITVILGKEMVLHPEDLLLEISSVCQAANSQDTPAKLIIDEMAFLCLDTHRAFEAVLKMKSTGSKGATGRGISPAYADVIYRHPLRMRDLVSENWSSKLKKHYQLYEHWISGFGYILADIEAPRLDNSKTKVGSFEKMHERLKKARKTLKKYIQPVNKTLRKKWKRGKPFVIEKAQALGLDKRWGVYPDVTASNCSFDGIFSSTEGIVDHNQLSIKSVVIKATYSSSVGARKLPTIMSKKLAERIRQDANEYGATTGRPRDIVHIDLPMLAFLAKVSKAEELALTHLDISYPDVPIKVCVAYQINNKEVNYRPDQEFLNLVEPVYFELPPWDGAKLEKTKSLTDLPQEAKQYIAFMSRSLKLKPLMITTGPRREQTIRCY